jgi:hypothetical protein
MERFFTTLILSERRDCVLPSKPGRDEVLGLIVWLGTELGSTDTRSAGA